MSVQAGHTDYGANYILREKSEVMIEVFEREGILFNPPTYILKLFFCILFAECIIFLLHACREYCNSPSKMVIKMFLHVAAFTCHFILYDEFHFCEKNTALCSPEHTFNFSSSVIFL